MPAVVGTATSGVQRQPLAALPAFAETAERAAKSPPAANTLAELMTEPPPMATMISERLRRSRKRRTCSARSRDVRVGSHVVDHQDRLAAAAVKIRASSRNNGSP